MDKRQLRLSKKKHSLQGMISTGIGGTFWLLVIVLIIVTVELKNANWMIGMLGFLSLIGCCIGIGIGIRSFFEQEVEHIYSYIGMGFNGTLLLFLIFLYLMGN